MDYSELRYGDPHQSFGGVEQFLKKTVQKMINNICVEVSFLSYPEICNLMKSVSCVSSKDDKNQESIKDAETEGVLIFWFLHFMS